MKRLKYLDGLRGLMSINVLLWHFLCVYYPEMCRLSWINGYGGRRRLFATTPLSVLINGNIAVQYFFILSGFLAALYVYNKDSIDLFSCVVKRYLRLLPVVAGATLFAFLLMKSGLLFHIGIAKDVRNVDYLLRFCNFTPDIKSLLKNAFLTPFWMGSEYVSPFWTIKYEIFGYAIVLMICSMSKGKKWRRLLYVLCIWGLWAKGRNAYCSFLIGAIIADLYFYTSEGETWFSRVYHKIVYHKRSIFWLYPIGLFFACIPIESAGIYRHLPRLGDELYRAAGLGICLWCIMRCAPIQKVLETKCIQFLGKISFTTYAFHWPVMLSLGAGLFAVLKTGYSYNVAAAASFLASLPVILAVSYCAYRLLEDNKWIASKRTKLLTMAGLN